MRDLLKELKMVAFNSERQEREVVRRATKAMDELGIPWTTLASGRMRVGEGGAVEYRPLTGEFRHAARGEGGYGLRNMLEHVMEHA